jgi:hypothetical protein
MWEDTIWKIGEALVPVIGGLVAWALAMAAKWLREKANNETATTVIALVEDAVTYAVREAEQTLVEDLKAKREDGKLTDDEKRDALQSALTAAKRALGEKGLASLEKLLGAIDVDKFLISRIEGEVHDLRNGG